MEGILFANAFLSYLMLLLVIVALAALGVFIGITLRKAKNSAVQTAEASAPAASDASAVNTDK
ncbi:MAG: hypothetical protein NC094_01540 [Bacteroidales bacterium]|nr:hypothetical protein [Lachnoclostridium sp.]MCM1384534.1 hypothetical protein [Lachnoclostridium sp.]MCM1464078.1 hypothetical protein [Bacteroidales bacterium]